MFYTLLDVILTYYHFNECVDYRNDLFDSKYRSDLLTLIAINSSRLLAE